MWRILFIFASCSYERNILFAHSRLELVPQKVNGQYLTSRGMRTKRRLPIDVRGQYQA